MNNITFPSFDLSNLSSKSYQFVILSFCCLDCLFCLCSLRNFQKFNTTLAIIVEMYLMSSSRLMLLSVLTSILAFGTSSGTIFGVLLLILLGLVMPFSVPLVFLRDLMFILEIGTLSATIFVAFLVLVGLFRPLPVIWAKFPFALTGPFPSIFPVDLLLLVAKVC